MCVCAGLSADWYPNLDWLKESCRIAGSYNWADVDLSPFQGKKKEYFVKTDQTPDYTLGWRGWSSGSHNTVLFLAQQQVRLSFLDLSLTTL